MIVTAIKTILRKFSFCPYSHPQTFQNLTFFYSDLLTHSISSNSVYLAKSIHGQLIKIGCNRDTFLGNCLIEVYSQLSATNDAFLVFQDVLNKNCVTWNLLLMGLFRIGSLNDAQQLFDEMPERDVVSWNSMISGFASNGAVGCAFGTFLEMQEVGMRANGYTFSIILSCVEYARHGKQIHGYIIKSGLNLSNVVLSNSLIDMYGKLNYVDYAFVVFSMMEEMDVISWNSMISGCEKCGCCEWALYLFHMMRTTGFLPDQFTVSTIVTVCANLRHLEMGKQIFAQCIRMGVLSSSIVSSAIIDMFSKCNSLKDSLQLFHEMPHWDSALFNVMIAGYAKHELVEDALWLFVLCLRENVKPTEFTFGSILSSTFYLTPVEQGTQIHSLVIKFGSDSDVIVASSLVDMYANFGLVDSAMKIFTEMAFKDLVTWNTMILGFARNGRGNEALNVFANLCHQGPSPDRITLAAALLAYSREGLVNEGWNLFSSMKDKYGVSPGVEHCACIVDMLGRAGKLMEAMEVIEAMPHNPNASIWGILLGACSVYGDMNFTETIAKKMIELDALNSLPYLALARIYEMKGKWESVVRVRMLMKERGIKKAIGCSWIKFKNQLVSFKANQILHHGGEDIYLMLKLLRWEMQNERYVSQHQALFGGGEE